MVILFLKFCNAITEYQLSENNDINHNYAYI